jgi:hypothetical protein
MYARSIYRLQNLIQFPQRSSLDITAIKQKPILHRLNACVYTEFQNYEQKRNLHSIPLHLQVPLFIPSIITRIPTLASSVRFQLMQLRRRGIHLEDGFVVSFHLKGVLR